MNKEELKCYHKIWSIIHKTDLLNIDEKDELHLFLMKFKDENKELHNKIDKAIEYIEKCSLGEDYYGNPVMLAKEDEGKDLLEILKESE